MSGTFTQAQVDFLCELGAQRESKLRQLALVSIAEACPVNVEFDSKETLLKRARPIFKRKVKENYNSILIIIAGIVLLTVFEAALTWAVETFLDWWLKKGRHARVALSNFRLRWNDV